MNAEARQQASADTSTYAVFEETSELKLGHQRRVCARDRKRRAAASVAKADVRPSAREYDRLAPLHRNARSTEPHRDRLGCRGDIGKVSRHLVDQRPRPRHVRDRMRKRCDERPPRRVREQSAVDRARESRSRRTRDRVEKDRPREHAQAVFGTNAIRQMLTAEPDKRGLSETRPN